MEPRAWNTISVSRERYSISELWEWVNRNWCGYGYGLGLGLRSRAKTVVQRRHHRHAAEWVVRVLRQRHGGRSDASYKILRGAML